MDKKPTQTAKETTQKKPKTIVERLKEKNLYGLFRQLEIKDLENIKKEAENAIPKKLIEAQQEVIDNAKKLGIDVELFAKLSGATEMHTVSTTAPETK